MSSSESTSSSQQRLLKQWKHYLPAFDLTVTAASERAAMDLEKGMVLLLQYRPDISQALYDSYTLLDDGVTRVSDKTECLCPVARATRDNYFNSVVYPTEWRELLAFSPIINGGGNADTMPAAEQSAMVPPPVDLEPWEVNYIEAAIQFSRFRLDACMALCVRNVTACWHDVFSARLLFLLGFLAGHMETMSESFSLIVRKFNAKANAEIEAMNNGATVETRMHVVRPLLEAISAFSMHESGALDAAERIAKKALQDTEQVNRLHGFPRPLDPKRDVGALAAATEGKEFSNVFAVHALCHVAEMRGRPKDGIQLLNGGIRPELWKTGVYLSVHIQWHLALFYLDSGDLGAMFEVYDDHLATADKGDPYSLADATSLLWRLQLLHDVNLARKDLDIHPPSCKLYSSDNLEKVGRGSKWRQEQFLHTQAKWDTHKDERLALIPFFATHKRFNRDGSICSNPSDELTFYALAKSGFISMMETGLAPIIGFKGNSKQQMEAAAADDDPEFVRQVGLDDPEFHHRSVNPARSLFCYFNTTYTTLIDHIDKEHAEASSGSGGGGGGKGASATTTTVPQAPQLGSMFLAILNGLWRLFIPHASTDPWTGGNPHCDLWARQFITSVKPVNTTIADSSAPASLDLAEALKLEKSSIKMLFDYATPMGGSLAQRNLIVESFLFHGVALACFFRKRGPVSGTVKPPIKGGKGKCSGLPDATKYIAAQADQISRAFTMCHLVPMAVRQADVLPENLRASMIADLALETII